MKEVWGVNANDDIYHLVNGQWHQFSHGKLKQIAVGPNGEVWGVNAADDIYYLANGTWNNVPGKLKQVSVGPGGEVWGVNAADDIYHFINGGWQQVPGKLKHVSSGLAVNTLQDLNSQIANLNNQVANLNHNLNHAFVRIKNRDNYLAANAQQILQLQQQDQQSQQLIQQSQQTIQQLQQNNALLQQEKDRLSISPINNAALGAAFFTCGVFCYIESSDNYQLKQAAILFLMAAIYIMTNRAGYHLQKFSASSANFFKAIGDAAKQHGFNLVTGSVQPHAFNATIQPNGINANIQPGSFNATIQPNGVNAPIHPGAFTATGTVQPNAVTANASAFTPVCTII